MRRRSILPYIAITAVLLLVITLPIFFVQSVRELFLSIASPALRPIAAAKRWTGELLAAGDSRQQLRERLDKLELENVLQRNRIEALLQQLSQSSSQVYNPIVEAVAARVIFRSPTSWSSSLWIDVGEEDNKRLGYTHIAQDSPILVGASLVGVIDYVGSKSSRVRLITDSGVTPSVRAARGTSQALLCWEAANFLLRHLAERGDIPGKDRTKEEITSSLLQLKSLFEQPSENLLMAKGELKGSSAPLWRAAGATLKGIGFNYDFSDAFGEARDLRSGAPLNPLSTAAAHPLLKVHDILVTTGLDGVFPPGLPVAEVVHVSPLQEGDYFYELIALPTAGEFDSISTVLVLPAGEGRHGA